jgi:release factor glutamine methyltransferase
MNQFQTAIKQLEDAGIGTARLDALVLLEDITGKDRTHLLAHPELELTHEQQEQLQKLLNRRSKHEPLAYIRGKTEFYGREFALTTDVLEPRPESETMIELLKTHFPGSDPGKQLATVIDVGTGSGALAITAALELQEVRVLAIDIDPNCLKIAKQNAKKYFVSIEFIKNNLLEPTHLAHLPSPLIVLANLPYVPDGYQINQAAMKEPRIAIFGGKDGLDLYRTMFRQLHEHFDQQVFVFTESLPTQHVELTNIAAAQKFTQITEEDFIQVFTNK